MIPYGSLVIYLTPKGKRYVKRLSDTEDWHSNEGVLKSSDVHEADFGDTLETSLGRPIQILEATLQDRGQEEAEHGAGAHGLDCLVKALPGGAHVEEEGVCALDAEAVPGIADMDLDVVAQARPLEVAAREPGKLFSCLVAHDAARGPAEPGEGAGEAA